MPWTWERKHNLASDSAQCFRYVRLGLAGRTFCTLGLVLVSMAAVACKNIVRDSTEAVAGPRHSVDYSYIKFAAYRGDRVLSAGEYKGLSTRAEVFDRAAADLRKSESCAAGTSTAFCTGAADSEGGTTDSGGAVQWIQLFLPDGSSCSVGQAPENTGIPPCLDRS